MKTYVYVKVAEQIEEQEILGFFQNLFFIMRPIGTRTQCIYKLEFNAS